jgi:hypothetical protein
MMRRGKSIVRGTTDHFRIDDMTPTPEARWVRLRTELCAWLKYPKNAVATLRAEREIFQPLMLAELAELVDDPDRLVEDADFFVHIHLLALLAEWRERAAWPLLLRLFWHLDRERYRDIYDVEGNEYLTPLVITLMPDGTAPLDEVQALLEAPEVSRWLRAELAEVLWGRVEKGILPREEVIPRLRQVLGRERAFQLAGNIEARDDLLTTVLLTSLAKLGDAESIPLVQPLFDGQLIDPWFWGDTVEDFAVYMRGEKTWVEKYPLDWVDDAAVFVKSHFFQPRTPSPKKSKKSKKFAPSETESETIVRDGPKIGRNDPCPCGSGKKYKKCCGA